ncbi:MAG TPA: gliding motility-associated C-terminal domain-containing protein, partial [Chitinophagaceae bacterium]|nr:gliding motility-associated C-terminal domain-containing protein [Chitinophagaceae bacterium]
LSSSSINNPVATPVNNETTYICTAIEGTCNARDSVFVKWKEIDLLSQTNVNCANAVTGVIEVEAGQGWQTPEYSIDGVAWQPTGSFNNIRVGNYFVKVRDGACVDSIPVDIIQAFPDLLIDNVSIAAASCSGDPDGEINISVSGGNSSYMYSLDGINFQSSNIFNAITGNYTITIQDGNGCLATQSATIPLDNIVTVDAGPDTSICLGRSYLLPAVSNGDAFQWTPATTLSDAAILNPEAMPDVETKYFITATKGICTRMDSVLISIKPSPTADAGPDIAICYGKVFELNGTGGTSFEWSPGTHFISSTDLANPSVKAVENITYSLFVTNADGCRSLTSDEVNITVTPAFRIFAGNDTIAAMNQPLQLNASEIGNAGVTEYNWLPATGLDDPLVANPVATLTQDTRYIVTGRTPEGCEAQDDVFIKVYQGPEIYVPKAFTPNNDGLNDILRAIPVGIQEFRHFTIYNRWGNVIFSTKDPARGWDGHINGQEQQTNTFVWIAEAIDYLGNHITRKGVITLIK